MIKLFCLLALSLQVFGAAVKRKTIVDKGTHLLECTQEPIELGIVLDSSSSIRHKDFRKGVAFIQNFLGQFDIGVGKNDVRVSIITFGKGVYTDQAFNLTSYKTKADVIAAVGRIKHKVGLYTATGDGIKYMHEKQLNKETVRPYAEKVGIVITDGNSQETQKTLDAAVAARNDNIHMFAVGIGDKRQVKEQELVNIAGDAERVTRVNNYDDLDTINDKLFRKTCIRKEKPTTTPLPMTQSCGDINPADVYFMFSTASQETEATAWTASFIDKVVDGDDMDVGFRYGVISGSCDDGFDLDRYSDVDDIRDHVDTYVRSNIPKLLKRLQEGYTEEKGARKDASKVAVLFLDKDKKAKKGDTTVAEAEQLVAAGVQVYIASPSGNPPEIPGATALFGRSTRQQSEDLITRLCPKP